MRKSLRRAAFVAAAALGIAGCAGVAHPEFALNFDIYHIYGSHMVLQQGRPIVFSGTADAGKAVRVEFAGKKVVATADASGVWRAEFPAMKADGREYTLTVSASGEKKIVLGDILLGEVWICSGQSNMEMPVFSPNPFWRTKNAEAERAAANHPNIRLFNSIAMRRTSPLAKLDDENGPGWVRCTPETVADFSALGYFFGRDLSQSQGVPVGLVNIAWGGTPIESWISEEAFRAHSYQRCLTAVDTARNPSPDEAEKERKEQESFQSRYDKWFETFYSWNPAATKAAQAWIAPDYDDSAWEKARFPYGIPGNVDGVAHFRCTFDLPAELAGKDMECVLGAIDDCDDTYLNGELIGKTTRETPEYWNFKRVYKIPGRLLKAGRNVLHSRVADFVYDGGMCAVPDEMYLKSADGREFRLFQNWKYRLEYAVDQRVLGPRPEPQGLVSEFRKGAWFPTTLFNAMLYPWCKYPCRGVIWYQGCSNAGQGDYARLNDMLIADWRKHFNNPELPFLLVQLAAFEEHHPEKRLADDYWTKRDCPDWSAYALTREMQAEMLRLPNVGMAVAMDVGDHSDIHPRDKQTLGFRLAREAERVCYGGKGITQGPLFDRMAIEGNRVRVFFRNVGKGLTTSDGKAPGAFALAGADGRFVWAKAKIDGDTVVVWADEIAKPAAVRYAWVQYRGDINLKNLDGFAAAPFRSDKPEYQLEHAVPGEKPLVRIDRQPAWDALCPEWKLQNTPEPREVIEVGAEKSCVKPGEPIVFQVRFLRDGKPVSGVKLKYELTADFRAAEKGEVVTGELPVELRTQLDRPGFARLFVSGENCNNSWGVGCEVLKIEPAPEVAGFSEFWAAQKKRLASVPAKELLCEEVPLDDASYSNVRCFDVQVACFGKAPVSGMLAMPKNAAPKSLPAYVFFHGAGVRPAFQPLPWAAKGFLAFNVNAHGLPNRAGAEFYRNALNVTLKDYQMRTYAKPEDSLFCDMVLRVMRALEYVKSRPEWDGRILVVHGGSQGGFQTLAAAGLDSDVTFAVANAPAMCNLGGALEGRTVQWPGTVFHGQDKAKIRSALMFDSVAFARRAKCPALITAGYRDCAAVPSSIFAAYNAYAGPKRLGEFFDLGHELGVFWMGEAEILDHVAAMKKSR